MKSELRDWGYRVKNRKIQLERFKNMEAPSSMIEKAEKAYQDAVAKFDEIAAAIGISEKEQALILAECEEYLKARDYLTELFPYLPTARVFKKFFDYGKRWHFAGIKPIDHGSFEDEDESFNHMTLDQLEEFLETNPNPDRAMHVLGIMADHALRWSQSILIEFLLLATRARKMEQDKIPREQIAKMIQAVFHQIEDELIEKK